MVYFLYSYISSLLLCADSILRSAHHHFTELVEVHRAGAVLVQLVDDPVQLLLGERLQQLRDQASQRVHRDEPFSILVVDSESRFKLPFEGLDIRILNKELCAKLAKFGKLDLPRSILVDLLQDRFQLLSAWSEAHRSENLVKVIC